MSYDLEEKKRFNVEAWRRQIVSETYARNLPKIVEKYKASQKKVEVAIEDIKEYISAIERVKRR
jgi:hypothetical protein